MVVQAAIYLAGYGLVRVKQAPIQPVTAVMLVNFLLISSFAWFFNEGLDGSTPFFFIMPVIICIAILRGWLRPFFLFLVLADMLALSLLQIFRPELVMPYPSLQVKYLDILYSFGVITIFTLGYITISLYNLDQRRKQADELLLNILPEPIAEQLKYNPSQTIAQDFSNVSILFADVVDFTPMSANLSPIELVSLLDEVFSFFDTLVERYGLEKIKTIGDCYMVAAGVPQPCADSARVITRLALEMRNYVSQNDFQGRSLSFRFGINTGSVIAGVIGRRKFIYDLWGDAVNTASRMETHGKANIIQITRSTYELIAEEFQCAPQGLIYVKGKGEMEVWHVMGQTPT
jgi:adenylate cyclase